MNNIITVTALNTFVKSLLETNEVLTDISIKGEISNFVNHTKTGHFYFSLKDASCSVKAVMFRGSNMKLAFMPQTGMSVVVRGKITLYERDGSFQIYVDNMFPEGDGAIQRAFNNLKDKLGKEGLFDEDYKKPIPEMPQTIGLVTSRSGAALQDILNVMSRRFPLVKLVLFPANVQGETAYKDIVKGVSALDKLNLDLIIIARGGGSTEDLWVFNHEDIARAVFVCNTPVISAIGHEIDFTILDFVADLRAATPSASAEISVPDIRVLHRQFDDLCINIQKNVYNRYDICYNNYKDICKSETVNKIKEIPTDLEENLTVLTQNINKEIASKLKNYQDKLGHLMSMSASLNPYNVLKRGYAVVTLNDKTVSINNLPVIGQSMTVKGDNYSLDCSLISINEMENGENNG